MELVRPIRILIVRVGAMGDVLHGLPAVTALKLRHPDWHIGWAIEPHWSPLLSPHVVDAVHLVPTRAWKSRPFSIATLREIASLRRGLRAQHYDIAIDLQGSIRSALIGRMASARRFIGPAHPRERQARALYTERVNLATEHVIHQACELVGAAVGEIFTPARIQLGDDSDARHRLQEPVGERGSILLVPTAGWGAKQWPPERFIEVARAFRATRHRVLINAAPGNDAIAQSIALSSGAELVVCGMEELVSLVRRADLVIGGDTGPVHLASALGTPTLALFGPTDPARNGPSFVGARTIILRHQSSRTDHRRHPEPEAGLMKITVEEVLTAARAQLTARSEAKVNG